MDTLKCLPVREKTWPTLWCAYYLWRYFFHGFRAKNGSLASGSCLAKSLLIIKENGNGSEDDDDGETDTEAQQKEYESVATGDDTVIPEHKRATRSSNASTARSSRKRDQISKKVASRATHVSDAAGDEEVMKLLPDTESGVEPDAAVTSGRRSKSVLLRKSSKSQPAKTVARAENIAPLSRDIDGKEERVLRSGRRLGAEAYMSILM